jgi:hypothetical protein
MRERRRGGGERGTMIHAMISWRFMALHGVLMSLPPPVSGDLGTAWLLL